MRHRAPIDEKRRASPALLSALLAAALLSACGGGETPRPAAVSSLPPPAAPAPDPAVNYNTAEYRRSTAAVAANVLPAWQLGISGAGVTIGIVDSGINAASPEFAGRILSASRDVTGRGRSITDEDGHGTSVAAVAAAARDNSGVVGIAPQANLAVMRADNGDCADGCRFSDAAIAAGIDASIAAGARVINISLGGPTASGTLRQAFARATAAGVVLVMSAGNDSLTEAGALPMAALQAAGGSAVIVAGASDADGLIADFSNRAGGAASNFLLARGTQLLSIDHQGTQWLMSGASFSAPTVAGAVALLAQYHPNLSAAQIVEILLSSATDGGAPGVDAVYGRGVLNIGRAIAPIGATSLAGTSVSVPLGAGGNLGSALGSGLSTGQGLGAIPITDGYGRDYQLNLGNRLRPAHAARLHGRLATAALATARAELAAGPFRAGLQLQAADIQPVTAPDAFRAVGNGNPALGFALRGVDARAANRDPLRETRFFAQAGGLRLTAAEGPQAAMALPGAEAGGFVADDGLSAQEGRIVQGARLFSAEARHGAWHLALSAASQEMGLPWQAGLSRRAWQSRLTLSAGWQSGPLALTARVADVQDEGALLGTRLDPAYGLTGGRGTQLGLAADWAISALRVRLAATQGWHSPDFTSAGLLRDGGVWRSASWSALAETGVAGGAFSLRIARPLVVTSAPLRLANGQLLDAAATARETSAEFGYQIGGLSVAAFHRADAGNLPGLQDSGAALSLRTRF